MLGLGDGAGLGETVGEADASGDAEAIGEGLLSGIEPWSFSWRFL